MALFANQREQNLRTVVAMVEEVLRARGEDVPQTRMGEDPAAPAWRLHKGSARITVRLLSRDEGDVLKVSAPVLVLDDKVDRRRLYARLLELHAGEVVGAAFALVGQEIQVASERPTLDLDRSEVEDLIRRVSEYADHWDDVLHAEFGGKRPQ